MEFENVRDEKYKISFMSRHKAKNPYLLYDSPDGLGWNSPLFANLRKTHDLDVARNGYKPKVTRAGYKCRNCNSTNTYISPRVTRALDEPVTVFIMCCDCKHEKRM